MRTGLTLEHAPDFMMGATWRTLWTRLIQRSAVVTTAVHSSRTGSRLFTKGCSRIAGLVQAARRGAGQTCCREEAGRSAAEDCGTRTHTQRSRSVGV